MTTREWDTLLTVLTEASRKDIFLELAFLESWVESAEKRQVGIPLAMMEAALPFLEEEMRWKPRLGPSTLTHPAWWRAAAVFSAFGALATSSAGLVGGS